MKINMHHSAPVLMNLVNCFIVQRAFMYQHNMCPVDANKRAALEKIKRHVDHFKNSPNKAKVNVIKYLLPDFETIMPGVYSKKYNDMRTKLDTITSIIHE